MWTIFHNHNKNECWADMYACMYVCKTLFKDAGSVSNLLVSAEEVNRFDYLQQRERNKMLQKHISGVTDEQLSLATVPFNYIFRYFY